jgi:Cellulase M and related proteins
VFGPIRFSVHQGKVKSSRPSQVKLGRSSRWVETPTGAGVTTTLLSVPDELVHGFQTVTDKRDVAICVVWKTEIDIYSLSHFTALHYPEQQSVKDIGRPDQKCQLCYKLCD